MYSVDFPLAMSMRCTLHVDVLRGVNDHHRVEAAFKALQPGAELDRVLGIAAQESFRRVAVLPALLLIVFAAIWLYDRSRGGYKAQKL